ncbi:hypothetical protein LJ739_06980 [Aestuariibacter halophilus]|uniref:Uncharacterized protein n=1 Tax=Fluctibacter halophilus TaxID=226011 RepID=A0ABS8G7D3_9ALTE|nr:hypothetical protein [Aestuariibacter halophilus]MCC2615981.1 hypothetical protein [Aestuariibacter halophilus]
MSKYTPVTQSEFHEFLDKYDGKLTVDVTTMCEPPTCSFNDFTLGNWPDSVVARCSVFHDDEYYTSGLDDYAPSPVFNGKLESSWKVLTKLLPVTKVNDNDQ